MSNGKTDPGQIRPYKFNDFSELEPLSSGVSDDGEFVASHPCSAARLKKQKADEGLAAKTILEEARGEAASLLAEARSQLAFIKAKAHEEGFAAGREEGLKQQAEAAESVVALAKELACYKSSLYSEARAQVVELALCLVGKVLGPIAENDQQAVIGVVKKGLRIISDREILTLRVSPEDLQGMIAAKPEIQRSFDGIQKFTVLEDPSVKPGGCIIQTPTSEIDARLDAQLQALARDLRNV